MNNYFTPRKSGLLIPSTVNTEDVDKKIVAEDYRKDAVSEAVSMMSRHIPAKEIASFLSSKDFGARVIEGTDGSSS